MIFLVQDAHSLGLKTAQGIYLTTAFYHDVDHASRAWSRRFMDRVGAAPSMLQAGVYSSVMHYLKAVKAAGSKDSTKVMEQMRSMPVEDFMTHGAHIREDGHLMREAQVKSPAESKSEWDLFQDCRAYTGRSRRLAAFRIEVSTGETLTLRPLRGGAPAIERRQGCLERPRWA